MRARNVECLAWDSLLPSRQWLFHRQQPRLLSQFSHRFG